MMDKMISNSDGTFSFGTEGQELFKELRESAAEAVKELIDISKLRAGEILVVGCSTSEVVGETIGKASVPEAAQAVLDGILSVTKPIGVYVAAQCCEHLNRALIVEAECAQRYGLT